MYCFRCGRKLLGKETNCPDCDTPQKKGQRRNKRMVLGLFIFLAGAIVGSFFDNYFFKGDIWKHSFFKNFSNNNNENTINGTATTNTSNVEVKLQYESNPITSEKENLTNAVPLKENFNTPTQKENNEILTQETNTNNQLVQKPAEDNNISSLNNNSLNVVSSNETVNSNIEETQPTEIAKIEDTNYETVSEENSNTDETIINDYSEADLQPKENLVYKNIKMLETSSRNSYHGFMSKNGKELIFASDRTNYNGKPTFQCYIKNMEVAKSNPTKVFSWRGNIWTPELTPDSNMVVFSSDSSLPEYIFLFDRKSRDSMALTSGKSKNMMPSISPDGKKIAFVSNRGDGKNRIYVMELLNSKKVTQITKGNVDDREPRWTPDGKSIIFTRIIERMKVSNIMKVDVEPLGEPIALVDNKTRNWMADISPDGSILAYTRSLSSDGSNNVIVLQDVNTGKEEILKFSGITDSFRPVWNKDCSGFVFHINTKNGKAIYQANFARE